MGITYNISTWEWKLCESKADRLTELLFDLIQLDEIQNKVLKRILGNISFTNIHVYLLIRENERVCHDLRLQV